MAASQRQAGKSVMRWVLVAVLVVAVLAVLPRAAWAQIGSDRYSSIVVDAGSGQVMEAANPDAPRHPASLAKVMTLYMVFEALRDRRIGLDTPVPVSGHAASMAPTKLGLMPSSRLCVEQAILALITKSANDAAAALAELLGGSEDRFAQMMTLRARSVGMSNTSFTNASGLPDPDQWTTARDLALLARRMVADFPDYYRYFSVPSFTYGRQVIPNHDHLLQSYPGADGLKTGYTEASGHNLITSAVRGGVRLIGVVLGAQSNYERDLHMIALLNQGYGQLDIPVEQRAPVQMAGGMPPGTPRMMPRGARGMSGGMPGLIATAHAAEAPARPTPRTHLVAAPAGGWSIQVGSFATQPAARVAAQTAQRLAGGGDARVEAVTLNRHIAWRAQVIDLTAGAAQSACSVLRRKASCMVLPPEPRVVASR
jgi:D-alanyl-D-alanine carboxypeptidase